MRQHIRWLPAVQALVIALLSILLTTGCGQSKSESVTPTPPATPSVVGEWKSIATNGVPVDLTMSLGADGKYEASSVDDTGHRETYSGTYRIGSEDMPSMGRTTTVEITTVTANGKPVPDNAPSLRLIFDAKQDILTDIMTTTFARADKAPAMKQALEEEARRRAGPPLVVDLGKWKTTWEVKLKERPLEYSVSTFDLEGDGKWEIGTTSEEPILILDDRGKTRFELPPQKTSAGYVLMGRSDSRPYIVFYNTWSSEVIAYDLAGKTIWSVESDEGVDCVAPIKLDAKNTGMVIGYNGSGGIQIVNANGRTLAHIRGPGNVWSVSSARLSKDLPEAALGVDEGAMAYSPEGKLLALYKPPGDVGAVYGMDLDGDGLYEVLTLGTTVSSGLKLTAFSADGKARWATDANDAGAFVQAPLFKMKLKGKGVIAVASGGGVTFYSVGGKKVGHVTAPITAAAPLPGSGVSDRLLLRAYGSLKCLELR